LPISCIVLDKKDKKAVEFEKVEEYSFVLYYNKE